MQTGKDRKELQIFSYKKTHFSEAQEAGKPKCGISQM